jgi:hypothetical protein
VEHYQPGLRVDELEQFGVRAAAAVRELQRQGRAVRFVRSLVVPGDEAVLSLVEAVSEQLVREAYTRSGIPFERISPSRVLTDSETESR